MNSIVALDVGSSSLKAVEVKGAFTKHPSIIRVAYKKLKDGLIDNGEIQDVPGFTVALKEMWHENKIRTQKVILGVDGPRTMIRPVDLPLLPLDLLRQALPLHVKNALPLPVDKFVLDFIPIRKSTEKNKVHGFLAAIEDNFSTNLLQACAKANLDIYRMDMVPFALARLFASFYDGKTTAVVNIGGSTTDVIIVNPDGVPDFIRVWQTGGEDITTNIADELNIERDEAEKLKLEVGLKPQTDPDLVKVSDIIRKSMQSFILGVRNTIRFYETSDEGTKVRKLIVTGGTSQMDGMSQAMSLATKIDYEEVSIFRGRSTVRTRIRNKESNDTLSPRSAEFTPAIGLVVGKDRK
jgi:type IV pilus assembly protein PilM